VLGGKGTSVVSVCARAVMGVTVRLPVLVPMGLLRRGEGQVHARKGGDVLVVCVCIGQCGVWVGATGMIGVNVRLAVLVPMGLLQ
jgi:hypothetical protein